MAGSNSGFDAADFRTQISFVMTMALPDAVQDRPTFRWTTQHTYPIEDPRHKPYDWGATPATTTSHADVQVPAVVQFQERTPEGTAVGQLSPSRAVLTLLDTDFNQIIGADQVLLGQDVYDLDLVGPPEGLFDVTLYTLYLTARDER